MAIFGHMGAPQIGHLLAGLSKTIRWETPKGAAVPGPFSVWLFGAQRPLLYLGSAKTGHFSKNAAPGVGSADWSLSSHFWLAGPGRKIEGVMSGAGPEMAPGPDRGLGAVFGPTPLIKPPIS